MTTVVKVTQKGFLEPEANCYILPPGGTINIPLSRANAFAPGAITNTSEVAVVWSEIGRNDGSPGLGSFKTYNTYLRASASSSEKEGNVVVAVTVNGEIKWSWHIWVTNFYPDAMAKPYTNTNGVTTVFMDRNLGALNSTNSLTPTMGTPESLGLLYQWGRKDPFPNSASATTATEKMVYTNLFSVENEGKGIAMSEYTANARVDVATTVSRPYYFYTNAYNDWCSNSSDGNTRWGASPYIKSIYDPCPAGWRVPRTDAWLGYTTSSFAFDSYGAYHEQTGWYPYAGERDGRYLDIDEGEGYYWSAEGTLYAGYVMRFLQSYTFYTVNMGRIRGFSVRCVQEE